MKAVIELTDDELRAELTKFGYNAPPVTETTRALLQKKVETFRSSDGQMKAPRITPPKNRPSFSGTEGSKGTFGPESFRIDDDDHMESSRIVSPKNRFRPSFSSAEGTFGPESFRTDDDDHMESSRIVSPKNRYRPSFSGAEGNKGAFGLKSFRIYDDEHRESSRFFSPKKRFRPSFSGAEGNVIGGGIVFFIVIIICAYVYQAHTETVNTAFAKGKDVTVEMINLIYKYAIFPAIAVIGALFAAFVVYKLYEYNRQCKVDKNRRLIELVERITDIIFESGSAGIAEPHVRDMLMPPTKRTESEYNRWQQAARFINNEDSRIRTEIRLIDGTECNVWIWTGAGKQRWQGTAVAEGSPLAKVPEQALTHCLKLRGLNFSDNYGEREYLKKELLAKMKPVVPKHIGFISNQIESVVYMMLRNLDDARRAFLAFHSHWFNGTMVTVKYVRDERYLERFPDAHLN